MSVFQSAVWDLAGRIANYVVTFVVSVILTRLLMPEEFGAFGIILAILVFSWVILDFGFRSAVVQAATISQTQLSSVFFVNLLLGAGIMLVLVLVGPPLARFYEIPELANYIIGVSPIFVLNGLFVVPSALIQRELKLKQMSIFTVVGAVISGGISIVLALKGFGVWSLVVSSLSSTVITVIACYWITGWRPTREFDLPSIKPLYDFGSRIFLSSLLDVAFTRADVFIIGKVFDVGSLGFYTRAQSIDQQVRMFSVSTIVTVMLPLFSRHQNDIERLRDIYFRSLHFISFVAIAASGLLVLTAYDLFLLLFTEKWIVSAGYFQIMSITSAAYPLTYLMLNLISGRGNSKALLRLEIFKKTLLVPAYLSFLVGGIHTFVIVVGVVYLVSLVLNMSFVKKELSESITKQLSVVGLYVAMSLLSALVSFGLMGLIPTTTITHFLGSAAIFGSVYLGLNWILKTAGFRELIERATSMLARKGVPDAAGTS